MTESKLQSCEDIPNELKKSPRLYAFLLENDDTDLGGKRLFEWVNKNLPEETLRWGTLIRSDVLMDETRMGEIGKALGFAFYRAIKKRDQK